MIWETWPVRWEAALQACLARGGDVKPLIIQPPASEVAVRAVEQELNKKLPDTFRGVLTQFSAEVQFRWTLPDVNPPEPFREIFSGECFWD
jgi:hypothetical protein